MRRDGFHGNVGNCISFSDEHEALFDIAYQNAHRTENTLVTTYLGSWRTETFRSVEEHAKRTNKCALVIRNEMDG